MGGLLQTLKGMGPARLAMIGAVGVALIVFFGFLSTRVSTSDYALLYGDLEMSDGAAIVARLEALGVPYEVGHGGGSVMVPADQVDRLRLAMAEQGLPAGGSLGYELFDQTDGFGTSNFVQQINRLRALEGELARTISTMAGIRQARVHLVLPERELFAREPEEPSASVFLRLSSAGLTAEQIQAIRYLVATAVPRLAPGAISIVDDRGNLLARSEDGDAGELHLRNGEEMRVAYERRLTEAIEALLSRSLGFGNVRAQVSVEMDFDRVTTTEEAYDPDGQVPRSTQLVEDSTESTEDGGLDPVSVAENLPEPDPTAGGEAGIAALARDSANRTEETVNYEISRTVRNMVREGGVVRRLSVAVLVDGTYTVDEEGTRLYAPRNDAELQQIAALVRSSIGFSETRGDLVEVINMPFWDEEMAAAELEEPATLLGMPRDDLFRIAEMLVLGVVAVLVILLVIRPLLTRVLEGSRGHDSEEFGGLLSDAGALQKALAAPGLSDMATPELPSPASQEEDELDALIDINQVEGRVRASSLRKIGEIVEKHPEEAVSIIRSWMYQET